jgi:hypothetical protein
MDTNRETIDPSKYFLGASILLGVYAFLFITIEMEKFSCFPIWISIPLLLLIAIPWIVILYYCIFNKDTREKLRKIHIKHTKWLIAFLFIFTYDFALLLSMIIRFNCISWNIYSDIFNSFIAIHATILSIVITLTIISIQLNIEKYSFDMVEFFKGLEEIWVTFAIFSLAIFFDLLVLAKSLPFFEFFFIFSIFSILSLFPYYWLMLAMMRPENLIQRFGLKHPGLDLHFTRIVLQIMYISIKKGEIGIVGGGLGCIEHQIKQEIPKDIPQLDEIINLLELIEKENNYSSLNSKRISYMKNYFIKMRDRYSIFLDDKINKLTDVYRSN